MPRTPGQALAFLLGLWIALALSPLRIGLAAGDDPELLARLEEELHRQVLAVRERQHLVGLRRLPELDRVARQHSADMAQRGYLSHDTPEGANPLARIEAAGISGFSLAAENIGRTSRPEPTREVVEGWLASENHRRNLFTPPFNATGIGVARAADGALIYTQLYVSYPARTSP